MMEKNFEPVQGIEMPNVSEPRNRPPGGPRTEPGEIGPSRKEPEVFPAKSPETHIAQPGNEIEPGQHNSPEIGPVPSPDATPEPGPSRNIPAG